jgi:phage tail-like protein
MDQSDLNTGHVDPFSKFPIRVKWQGRYVAWMSKTTVIQPTGREPNDLNDASTDHKAPGRRKYEPITLEQGITHDKDFEQWASGALNRDPQSGRKASDIFIEIYDAAAKRTVVWTVHQCWVSNFHVKHNLDNKTDAIKIERITLEHQGCERVLPWEP